MVLAGFTVVGGALAIYIGNVKAGQGIHHNLLDNVVKSPMSFFDSTPIGRILNRFGKDIDTMDTLIPHNIQVWLTCFLRVLSVPVIVVYSTPMFLVTLLPISVLYFVVQVS